MPQYLPVTKEEWMTHVLNIHGTPFEHFCQHYLQQSPDWIFRNSRYPVEFPPSYSPLVPLTKNSELDLWGVCRPSGLQIELLVECNKNDPNYTDWVFFSPTNPAPEFPFIRTLIYNRSGANPAFPWRAHNRIHYLVSSPTIPITDDGRETKGNYQAKWQSAQRGEKVPRDFTKTSNAAITDAAYQIALATQALLHQERRNQEALAAGKVQPIPSWCHVFLPLIVTTANLWTCHFSAEKVNSTTGEIPFSEVQYQQHPYLFFNYALPPILQFHPGEDRSEYRSDKSWEELARFSILVVQSAAFPDLLTHLSRMTKDGDGRLVLSTL